MQPTVIVHITQRKIEELKLPMMAIQRMKMMIQMLMTRKSKYSVTIIALPYRLGYTENAFAYLKQEFFLQN